MTNQITVPRETFDAMRKALESSAVCIQLMSDGPSRASWGDTLDIIDAALAAANAVSEQAHPQVTEPAPSTAGEWEEKVVSLPIPLSAFHLKLEIAELIQSHKYKGLRSIEVLGVFQFLSADIISGSST